MVRAWQHPPVVQIDSPHGRLQLTLGERVVVQAAPEHSIRVNSVEYELHYYLTLDGDGVPFEDTKSYFLVMRRREMIGGSDRPTPAAQRKVRAVLLPIVASYLARHASVVEAGRRATTNNELHGLECRIESLQEQIDELRAQHDALTATL